MERVKSHILLYTSPFIYEKKISEEKYHNVSKFGV